MVMNNTVCNSKKNNKINIFRYILVAFATFSTGFILLKFPECTYEGVKEGLDISFNMLIPSLFPFLVFSAFVVNSEICTYLFRPLKKIIYNLFLLPEQAITVFALSVIGGYPIGPQMIKKLYEKGEISQLQGKKMLLFCMNPSPAFVISTVGYLFLESESTGIIIFLSIITSSTIIGILQRFIIADEYPYKFNNKNDNKYHSVSQVLIKSVENSVESAIRICAWVMLFNCLLKVVDSTVIDSSVRLFIYGVCEVTAGCNLLSKSAPVPTIAGALAFGGICTHLQILPCIKKLNLKYKYFFTSRILISALSVIICKALISIFPESIQTVSIGNKPIYSSWGVSAGVTISIIILSLLILIGDNHIFKIRKTTDIDKYEKIN